MEQLNLIEQNDNLADYRRKLYQENKLDNSLYYYIGAYQLVWDRMLNLQYSVYNIPSRVCSDIANTLLTKKIKINALNDKDGTINLILQKKLFEEMDIMGFLATTLPYALGIGNALYVTYRDSLSKKVVFDMIPGYNVIPKTFVKRDMLSCNWLSQYCVDNKNIILKFEETDTYRKIEVMNGKKDSEWYLLNNLGLPLWMTQLLSDGQIIEQYGEGGHKKFAWFTTSLPNSRWINTPFNKGFCFPIKQYMDITEDIDNLNKETSWDISGKKLFVKREFIQDTSTSWLPFAGQQVQSFANLVNTQQYKMNNDLYVVANFTGENPMIDIQPTLLVRERILKMENSYKLLGHILGLGYNFYNFEKPNGDVTATQVILNLREAYNTIQPIKFTIENIIKTLIIGASDYWFEDGELTKEQWNILSTYGVGVELDDGVFVDKKQRLMDANQVYSAGVLSKFTYLTQGYGMSDQAAMNEIQRKNEELLAEAQLQAQLASLLPPTPEKSK